MRVRLYDLLLNAVSDKRNEGLNVVYIYLELRSFANCCNSHHLAYISFANFPSCNQRPKDLN